MNTALGGAAITLDVARGTAEAFGPLKAILAVISAAYSHYEVCSLSLSQTPSLMDYPQQTVAVRNKIDSLLSRIGVLEALFAAPAGGVTEEERRNELLRYATALHPNPSLISFQRVRGN